MNRKSWGTCGCSQHCDPTWTKPLRHRHRPVTKSQSAFSPLQTSSFVQVLPTDNWGTEGNKKFKEWRSWVQPYKDYRDEKSYRKFHFWSRSLVGRDRNRCYTSRWGRYTVTCINTERWCSQTPLKPETRWNGVCWGQPNRHMMRSYHIFRSARRTPADKCTLRCDSTTWRHRKRLSTNMMLAAANFAL